MFSYPARPSPKDLLAVHPDFERAFVEPYAQTLDYTMTSPERLYGLWQATRHIVAQGVPGAIAECGVWRGGSMMLVAHTLLASGQTDRELWLYDTFAGMPAPSAHDVDFTGVSASQHLERAAGDREDLVLAIASLEEVRRNLERIGYPPEQVVYIQGQVESTIPIRAPNQLALLRLDTDWETSTRHELEHLWHRLVVGGVLIIDDYGHWSGARRAVDEFFAARADAPLLTRIDYTGRVGVRARPPRERGAAA